MDTNVGISGALREMPDNETLCSVRCALCAVLVTLLPDEQVAFQRIRICCASRGDRVCTDSFSIPATLGVWLTSPVSEHINQHINLVVQCRILSARLLSSISKLFMKSSIHVHRKTVLGGS